jgi:hypothetical protein
MWTITILGMMAFGIFLYFKKQQRQGDTDYYKQHRSIFEAHERLGFIPILNNYPFPMNQANCCQLTYLGRKKIRSIEFPI